MKTENRPFELIDALDDLKAKIDKLVNDESVIVYSQNDLEGMPELDPRLQDPDQGFVSIMYAGMRGRTGAKNVSNGVDTTARFVIAVSFKNDKLRIAGIESPVTMIRFMTELRRALTKQLAPNNKTYTFISETPWDIPGKGDGYAQEWNLSLTAFS
ncbi:tail-completion protein [Vibrio phage 1.215.B._10N.222.54.F7]|nr:tail-completion protein [Vibrio phage 1.215.A._10N.222.54.F7]AUR96098.1 tail-completion protein [Vibrio phage 1.215.B._10N.222.54.F7]